MFDELIGRVPTVAGLADAILEAHALGSGRPLNARSVEQLHRLSTATETNADDVRQRAASRERTALLRAAAAAGLGEDAVAHELVGAGYAARRLGITRERLRQLADDGAIDCFKTSLGRVYRSEDVDRLSAQGWSRRQEVSNICSAVQCKAVALDSWKYLVVGGVEIEISLCSSHISEVIA